MDGYNKEEISNKNVADYDTIHINTEIESRHKTEVDNHGTVDESKISIGKWEIGPYHRRSVDSQSNPSDDTAVKSIEVGK